MLCQETGCAQRYLAHDAFSGAAPGDRADRCRRGHRSTASASSPTCTTCRTATCRIGIAMTDAKGDRSRRPHQQANPDSYVHIVERDAEGHRHLRHQGDRHRRAVHARVPGHAVPQHERRPMPTSRVCCAVPCDADGLTIVARPAGRPGEKAALFSNRYGQSTGVLDLRPRLRAVGARLPRRRMAALRAR